LEIFRIDILGLIMFMCICFYCKESEARSVKDSGGKEIIEQLKLLIKKVIRQSEIPEEWRRGMMHKKGEKADLNNYRGINLSNNTKINKNCKTKNYEESRTRRATTRISKWAIMHRCSLYK
jgi:hypothetical protein